MTKTGHELRPITPHTPASQRQRSRQVFTLSARTGLRRHFRQVLTAIDELGIRPD